MTMKIDKILKTLEDFAPYSLAESWDNNGLLIGDRNMDIDKILLSLDCTAAVIDEAIDSNIKLIVCHHPVIFTSINRINTDTLLGKSLIKAIKNDISIICMHTNLDCAKGGVNDMLALKLNLTNIQNLGCGESEMLGRIGETNMDFEDFIKLVSNNLSPNSIRYVAPTKKVCKVAVGGGACSKLLPQVKAMGADTFVTSECSYDIMQKAVELGVNLIDAGHFATENVVLEKLSQLLNQNAIVLSQHSDIIKQY